MFFCKYIRVKDSNRAEVLAILDALSPYSGIFLEQFIVESESLNAISWVNSREESPWKLKFIFNEIKSLSSIQVAFTNVS